MKQEDKELLLKDLCSRLPYGVKGYADGYISTLEGVNVIDSIVEYDMYCQIVVEEFTPYLFPLSSITPKQKAELSMLVVGVEDIFKSFLIEVEFYHKHHIDYRGLIPMGLAVDATGLNIY